MVKTINDVLMEYKVELNTATAIGQVKDLGRKRQESARGSWMMTTRGKRLAGRLIRRTGLSIPRVGADAHKSRVSSLFAGNSDPWNDAMMPATMAVYKWMDDMFETDVRAKRQARRATSQKLGRYFSETKDKVGVKMYADHVEDRVKVENDGRDYARASKELKAPGFQELIGQALDGYVVMLSESLKWYRSLVED